MRLKVFDGKSQYSHLFLIQNFSIPEKSEILKGSPTKFFGTVRQKNSTANLDPPPPLIQIFSTPENNATVKDSPEEISAVCDEKIRR